MESSFYFIYMTECEKHDELERLIQTHTDLTNRHLREYNGNQRNELIKIDKEYPVNKVINLIETIKNSISSTNQIPLELLLSRELTKQKELELKQKELEVQLELKKMEFQLQMRKLNIVTQSSVTQSK